MYGKEYYDGEGKGGGYWKYDDGERFNILAGDIVSKYSPASVFCVGCAKGYEVDAFERLGIKSGGIDISEYASSFNEKVKNGDITKNPKCGKWDVIVCIDVLEHIPESELDAVRDWMRKTAKRFYFQIGTLNTPDWQHDPTHVTIKDVSFWKEWMPEAEIHESV